MLPDLYLVSGNQNGEPPTAGDEFNAEPTWDDLREALRQEHEPAQTAHTHLITVVPLHDFITVTEDIAEPLIGSPDDALLDATGMLLMYGDGGAGKTTLSIDALAHLASGTDWLGLTIPKPVRILLIENEGPRMPFRRKLAAKVASWVGKPFLQNVHVLEEPWTHFTLSDPEYRASLATEIARTDSDLVMVGPLASIGAKGTGTPDEISEFDSYIGDLRSRCPRPFAPWIVHHENKAGDVSGAWERLPDSLVHIQAQGNGRTRIHWRKVRWSSTLHGTSTNLHWAEGAGFTVEDKKARDLTSEIVTAYREDDSWRTAREVSELINANVDTVRDVLNGLVKQNVLKFQTGLPGRAWNAKCWRLNADSDTPSQPESATLLEGFEAGADSLTPPMKESERSQQLANPDRADSNRPSQPSENNYSDIPF